MRLKRKETQRIISWRGITSTFNLAFQIIFSMVALLHSNMETEGIIVFQEKQIIFNQSNGGKFCWSHLLYFHSDPSPRAYLQSKPPCARRSTIGVPFFFVPLFLVARRKGISIVIIQGRSRAPRFSKLRGNSTNVRIRLINLLLRRLVSRD